MSTYDTLERWTFEEKDDPEDKSRKEIQVVRRDESGRLFVRAAYYGPSGRFANKSPTYDIREEVEGQVLQALEEAFDYARHRDRVERELSNFDGVTKEDAQKLAELVDDHGSVDELMKKLTD